jgi:glycerophosphoryl diester phosphodiesterase
VTFNWELSTTTKIIAHRGFWQKFAQNSLQAILAASQICDGSEVDLRMTKDHKVVLSHDPVITFNKQQFIIKDSLYSDLQQSLTSLEEVFAHLKGQLLNLEIKTDLVGDLDSYLEKMFSAVSGCIEKFSVNPKSLLISSFDSRAVELFSQRNLGTFIGQLLGPNFKLTEDLFQKVDFIVAHISSIKAEQNSFIPERTIVWTVDDPDEMRFLFNLNIYGVITNKPDLAHKVAASH